MAAEATEAAQEAQDEVAGLAVRIEDAEAEAALSEDALGDIIEKLDALGFKTTVSEEGTVTITAPKVTPQKAPAKKSGGVKATGYNTGGVEQWRTLTAKYFGANVNAALSVMRQESGGNPNATNSSSGCAGLFQIHPCHAAKFKAITGTSDMHDPEANIRFAAYMSAKGTNWSSWTAQPN
jgi:soluble lytic murein transglycosylase-like protein